MPAILCLGKELGLTTEVLILRKDEENILSHKVTDYTLPVSCFPVVIMKKIASAVTQVYHLPDPDERVPISNLFKDFHELLGVVCFPTDIVLDTTLNADFVTTVKCKEFIVLGEHDDIKDYKMKVSSTPIEKE
ncbi:uncharacterized protein LOC114950824 [Acropora millepora]|uniref:uncharacterized protein LOC114950824 n=1 Tax=Acropora millepora TaxID=45264 RepID=UPI001CF571F2|nr:uncharacterized protein LOC114950824 [Acropora millepora]